MADDINLKPLLLGDAPATAIAACADKAEAAARRGLGMTPGVDWAALATAVGEKTAEMFDIPLLGLLARTWKDFNELKDCADTGGRVTLPLVDHDLEASFAPHLDIAVSGVPTVRVDFEISAALEFEGIELVIEAAVIRSVRIGSLRAAAKLKCNGLVLFERSSCKLELPGEIDLAEVIPIGFRH